MVHRESAYSICLGRQDTRAKHLADSLGQIIATINFDGRQCAHCIAREKAELHRFPARCDPTRPYEYASYDTMTIGNADARRRAPPSR